MSCSSIDLKAYLLGEMPEREKSSVENHVRACQGCREEQERLRFAHAALLSLPDVEVPQRIAFVSDKVFEPRWWQKLWRSGPAMGFGAAVVLTAAILVHGFTRPAVAPARVTSVDTAKIEQQVEREVNARVQVAVNAAVTKAISETDSQRDRKFAEVLDAAEKRYEMQRRVDLAAVQQTVRYYDQQMGRLIVASNDLGQERTAR